MSAPRDKHIVVFIAIGIAYAIAWPFIMVIRSAKWVMSKITEFFKNTKFKFWN
jgi:hypothetical protein